MQNINLSDNITMKGVVKIEALHANGEVETVFEDKNLIVAGGREAIADLLAGKKSASAINDIAFGDGGVLPNNDSIAIGVSPKDIRVNSRLVARPKIEYLFSVDSVKSPTPRVVASITVPKVPIGFSDTTPGASSSAGLNGKKISELALMMQDNTAFSIKRFPAIPKSDEISLIITWTIYL